LNAPLAIKVSPRAQAQIEAAAAWWAQNRPAAPGAVRDEVARILGILSTQPGIGVTERRRRIRGLRRVNLSRIDYYIFYRVSRGVLEILAFWHTSRGSQPKL
jgi:plasmid stabilization system protein ParE